MASRKRIDESLRRAAEDRDIAYRTCAVRATSDVAADAGIPVTLVTENRARAYDWERGEVVDEIIVLSGVSFPKQVPLLDAHNRWTSTAQMGSVRSLAKGEDSLDGEAFFSRKQVAQELRQDVIDGHATDASVGARILEKKWVDKGQKVTIRGKTYEGPVRLITRSQVFELSIVPIGADSRSKFSPAQRAYFDPEGLREDNVNEEFKKFLVSRGMPESLSDEEAVRWAEANLPKPGAQPPSGNPTSGDPAPPAQRSDPPANPPANPPIDEAAIRRQAQEAERTRIAGIDSLVRMATLTDPEAIRTDLVKRGLSVDEAARHILETQSKGGGGPLPGSDNTRRIAPGPAELDKFRAAMADGLTLRRWNALPEDRKPADGANEFRGRTLIEIGRDLCDRAGLNSRGMGASEVAMRLLGVDDGSSFSLRAGEGSAFYNVSGMFNAVTLDVANNSLRKSYTEARVTYPRWTKRGASFTDFKERANSILGELPDPKVIPENDDIPEVSYKDSKEGYTVEIYGLMFSITLQAILNNSLNAFTDAPSKMGRTFPRKLNKLCVSILTANDPLQADATALFHANHNNLGTQGAIGKTTLDEVYKLMMMQGGVDPNVICGAEPRFILMPPAISGDALQFFGSRSVAINTAGNSETKNVYGPDGDRGGLERILEPQLQANSATAWYVLADPAEIDTIEHSFLEGFETPFIMRDQPINRLGVRYAAVQGFAAKALDFRGVFKNVGS